jgi:L-fuconolactonase
VGVRELIQGEPDGFSLSAEFQEGVRVAGSHDLAVDLCTTSRQLREVAQLVASHPDVRFVLDHCGKPDVAGGERTDWRADLQALARLGNISCKLSGLTTEADDRTRDVETIGWYLRTAVDLFGPGRCLFGSDWPNAGLTISYEGWVDMVRASVADLADGERQQIMHGNARSIYRGEWLGGPAEVLYGHPTADS